MLVAASSSGLFSLFIPRSSPGSSSSHPAPSPPPVPLLPGLIRARPEGPQFSPAPQVPLAARLLLTAQGQILPLACAGVSVQPSVCVPAKGRPSPAAPGPLPHRKRAKSKRKTPRKALKPPAPPRSTASHRHKEMPTGMGTRTMGLHRGPPSPAQPARRGAWHLQLASGSQQRAKQGLICFLSTRERNGAGGSIPTVGSAGKPRQLRALPSPARWPRFLPPGFGATENKQPQRAARAAITVIRKGGLGPAGDPELFYENATPPPGRSGSCWGWAGSAALSDAAPRGRTHLRARARVCRHVRVCTHCAEQNQAETDLQLSRVVLSQEKYPSLALPGGMQAWELPSLPHHPFLAHGWYLSLQEFTSVAAPGQGALCRSVPWGSHEPPTAQGSSPRGPRGPRGHPCLPFSARQLTWGEGGTAYGTAGWGGGPSAESRRNGNPLPRLPGQSPLVPQPRGGCTRRSVPTHHPEHPTSPPPCRGQHPSPNRPGPLCSLPRPAPMTDAWQSPGTTRQVFKNIN